MDVFCLRSHHWNLHFCLNALCVWIEYQRFWQTCRPRKIHHHHIFSLLFLFIHVFFFVLFHCFIYKFNQQFLYILFVFSLLLFKILPSFLDYFLYSWCNLLCNDRYPYNIHSLILDNECMNKLYRQMIIIHGLLKMRQR